MGRGRAKAKQTKVARRLKYHSPDTDLSALERELAGHEQDPFAATRAAVASDEDGDDDDEDPYAAYADDEDDEGEDLGRTSRGA